MRTHIIIAMLLAATLGASVAVASAASRGPRTAIEAPPAAPAALVTFEVDCDTARPGVQSACTLADGAFELDVDLVIVNRGSEELDLASFNFELATEQTILQPKPGVDQQLNANPDFADFPVANWVCTPPAPNPDKDPSPTVAVSFLSCFKFGLEPPGPPIPAGESLVVATVHYAVVGGGTATLSLSSVSAGDPFGFGFVFCYDDTAACPGATVTSAGAPAVTATPALPTPTPEPWIPPAAPAPISSTDASLPADVSTLAIDCAPAIPGVQSSCEYAAGTQLIAVDIVYWNVQQEFTVSALTLEVTTDQSVLDPRDPHDGNLDANPDFADLAGNWRCEPPPPQADADPSPSVARSYLDCIGAPGTDTLPVNSLLKLATVYYDARDGAATVTLSSAGVGGNGSAGCTEPVSPGLPRCISAFIGIGALAPVPTATPTVTPTWTPSATPTATATPTAPVSPPGGCVTAKQRVSLINGVFRRMGTQAGERRYSIRYDVNRDGIIDSRDALTIAAWPACARGWR